MVLLQAAMAGGFLLIIFFGLFMLIGIPMLTTLLMKLYWRASGKKNNITSGQAYYKDVIPFISILVFSIIALLLVFYMLIILFDKIYPAYGLSN